MTFDGATLPFPPGANARMRRFASATKSRRSAEMAILLPGGKPGPVIHVAGPLIPLIVRTDGTLPSALTAKTLTWMCVRSVVVL